MPKSGRHGAWRKHKHRHRERLTITVVGVRRDDGNVATAPARELPNDAEAGGFLGGPVARAVHCQRE